MPLIRIFPMTLVFALIAAVCQFAIADNGNPKNEYFPYVALVCLSISAFIEFLSHATTKE